ncbi:stage III sporulation protein AB [Ruminococcus sp.]|uniref:stage III sporulation protein AB n=1 Tax=Ruminococcus sp. TaxID=41978 RepID=UPI0025D6AC0B|nr:stage III sporulation protein AB [Ruminococcus sp.]
MYIRIAAIIFIILCGVFWGMNSSEKLRIRGDICSEIEKMLRLCEYSIRVCDADVYGIITKLKASDYLLLAFLNELPENYDENGDFHSKWRSAVLECQAFLPEERNLLLDVGNFLGTSDTECQLRTLAVYQERAQELFKLRTTEYRVKGRLYRSLGLLAGVTVGIIAI